MTGDTWGASESGWVGSLPSDVAAAQLAELAATRPDLWDEIWNHPNCYDGLRQWIAQRYEEQQAASESATLSNTPMAALAALAAPAVPAAPAVLAVPAVPAVLAGERRSSFAVAIIAAIMARLLVLAGIGAVVVLTGTFDTWFGGSSAEEAGLGVSSWQEETQGASLSVAESAPEFVPACPGETILLAWMELEDGWIVVCGVDENTPSYVAYQPGAEGKPRFSLGAAKPSGEKARSSVRWDVDTNRYIATMADGSKLTLDYSLGMATMRDATMSSSVSEQQRFVRYVFVPMGEGVRSFDEAANETGAFDVKAPKAIAEDQIRYMIEVLEKAYEGRAMLKNAFPKLAGCTAGPGEYADTVAAMQAVRDNRAELLTALNAMPVDKIPEGKQMLADLTLAIEFSYQANVEYVAWAEATNASGCATLSAAGKAAADASDAPKERFAARWNSVIVPQYGVRSFDGWYI